MRWIKSRGICGIVDEVCGNGPVVSYIYNIAEVGELARQFCMRGVKDGCARAMREVAQQWVDQPTFKEISNNIGVAR